MRLLSIPVKLSEGEAISVLCRYEPDMTATVVGYAYYPYLQVRVSAYMKMLSKEIKGELVCLVDMVNGAEAIAEDFGPLVTESVDGRYVLPTRLALDEARSKAISYVFHLYAKKLKGGAVPAISFVNEQLLYKLFWLMKCKKGSDEFHVIMDSINGQFHPCYL